ncbi:MAG: 4Fe-4S dicluster domain-containing protein [Candidatus Methylarchaceae archaeon HK01M]|nr:4Fe-4S dicluster domain-containing protein [Candidatus Methylarchaceae archaeon HK01M]
MVSIYNRPSMFFDLTKCIACRACQVACKRWNKRLAEETSLNSDPTTQWTNPPTLSSNTWRLVKYKLKYDEVNDEVTWTFIPYSCMHCNDPPCVGVCPTKAVFKRDDGIVHIHSERCIGCGYCIEACPYKVRFFADDEYFGIKSIYKCTYCLDRLDAGLSETACVQACPTEALEFGEYTEMHEKARQRAKAVGGYIYGDESPLAGGSDIGTSSVYVSNVPFEELGFPTEEQRISAPFVMERILLERGGLAIFGLGVLSFLGFALWRRERIGKAKMRELSKEE